MNYNIAAVIVTAFDTVKAHYGGIPMSDNDWIHTFLELKLIQYIELEGDQSRPINWFLEDIWEDPIPVPTTTTTTTTENMAGCEYSLFGCRKKRELTPLDIYSQFKAWENIKDLEMPIDQVAYHTFTKVVTF